MNAVEVKIRPEKNLISLPLCAVREYAGKIFDDKKTVEKIVLALEEALNNVLSYSMSNRLEHIIVTAEADDGEFTVSVIDKGLPGNYDSILTGDERIGLTLMRSSVDEIYIENMGTEGRKQKLVKYYCSIPDAEKLGDDGENKPFENIELTFRPAEKSDVLNICRAFYNEYGLTYLDDTFFYPERLFAAISKGRIRSNVAVDQYGRLAGHHGAKRWTTVPGIWEAGMAIVNGNYRNMGIFKKLMARTHDFVENEAKGRMLVGCCVTTHPYSQKTRLKAGSFPCGFALCIIPPDVAQSTFSKNTQPTSEAIAATIYDFTPKTVYLDSELLEAASFIYGGLKLEREIISEPTPPKAETTISKCFYNSRCRAGEINVSTVGKDFESRLGSDILELKKQGSEVMTLYISLEDAGAADVYNEAKKQGFFFCGILPNAEQGDVLRMQKMLINTIDYDYIVTVEEFTTLLNMIRSFDPDAK